MSEEKGRVWCYARVSSLYQAHRGVGLFAQRDMCIRAGNRLIEDSANLEWGSDHSETTDQSGLFMDEAISAYCVPFEERKEAKKLLKVLRRGDVLVIARLCRMCRSVEDYYKVVSLLERMGVRLIVVAQKYDTGSAIGRLSIGICVAMAEFESARKSERIRDALRAKKLRDVIGDVGTVKDQKRAWASSEYRPARYNADGNDDPETELNGRIFMYTRVSHATSAQSGLGMLAQSTALADYANELMSIHPRLSLGEMYSDMAESASQKTWASRTQGKQLFTALRDGDHILVYNLDRAFRNVREMLNVLDSLQKRNITVHFVNERFDMSSPEGKLVATIAGAFAEMETMLTKARTKEAKAFAVANGKFLGGHNVPPFWRRIFFFEKNKLVLDRQQIAQFRCIRFLMNSCGMTQIGALHRMEEMLAKRENRKPIPLSGVYRVNKWKNLGRKYKFLLSREGMFFPMWTRRRYEHASLSWNETIELWWSQRDVQRECLGHISKRKPLRNRCNTTSKIVMSRRNVKWCQPNKMIGCSDRARLRPKGSY